MTPHIKLSSWLPDEDPTTPGIISDVLGLIPTQRGYMPDRELEESAWNETGLPSACRGASLLKFSSYTPVVCAGTSTKLYSFFGALTDISRTATYSTIDGPLSAWRFESFGDTALAVSAANQLQATDGAAAGVDFQNVSGAPAARTMCVQSNFVLLANMDAGSWAYGDGVWCSGIEDYTDWDADLATQGKQMRLLQTPGAIERLYAFSNYVIAFKSDSMLRGTYVGTPTVWRWDVISTAVGLVGHNAVCDAQGVLYWMARDGFYRFNGGTVQRIASAPFEWMLVNVPGTSIYGAYVQAHWDSVRRVVRWYLPSATDPNGLQTMLAYHPETDRWGKSPCDIEWALSTYYDDIPRGTSDTKRQQYYPAAVFDVLHDLSVYSGSATGSTLTTGDVGDDDIASTVFRVRARYVGRSPTDSSLTHYHRKTLSDTLELAGPSATLTEGRYDINHGARWHRFVLSQTGGYELLGFSVDPKGPAKR